MQKENQRVAISKRLLKEGILRLLETKNIRSISVSELCEEASINRTTFYRHYQTTNDVFTELVVDFVNELMDVHTSTDRSRDMQTNTSRICHFLYDHRETARLFIRNDVDNQFWTIFQNCADEYISSGKVLYRGTTSNPNTLHMLATYCAHGIYSMIRKWLMEEIPMSPEEIADLIFGSFDRDFCFV